LLKSRATLPAEIASNDNIAVAKLPEATAARWLPANGESDAPLRPREFTGAIDRSWGIASFTRLISGRETDELDEGPLLETAAEEEEIAMAAEGIHAFPKGMRAGTCLHEILEQVDFANLATAPEIVQRRLRAYSIEDSDEVVVENIRALATLPLRSEKDRFTLGDVPGEKRIAELEFSFPIDSLTTVKLARILKMPEVALRLERLQFETLNGFMKGFIDLTFEHGGRFYFADWKSNWLGPNKRSYHASAIAAEMQHNFYTLQLCLYSVALHRYLRVRKPDYDFEQHFGGAFYVFMRGIDVAQPQNGVYFQRLSRGFVEKLSRVFEP
jgi:exodeoxyribonuclease V beta subunit